MNFEKKLFTVSSNFMNHNKINSLFLNFYSFDIFDKFDTHLEFATFQFMNKICVCTITVKDSCSSLFRISNR